MTSDAWIPALARPCRCELTSTVAPATVRARHGRGEATVLGNDLTDHRAPGLPRRMAFHHDGGTLFSHTRATRPGPRGSSERMLWTPYALPLAQTFPPGEALSRTNDRTVPRATRWSSGEVQGE